MRIYCWGRQKGKTTNALEQLSLHKDALLFVPSSAHKTYVKERAGSKISDRIFSARSNAWIGREERKAIIDETSLIDEDILRRIDSSFEIISIYFTPSGECKWLTDKIYDYSNSFHRIPASDDMIEQMKKISAPKVLMEEGYAKYGKDPKDYREILNNIKHTIEFLNIQVNKI